MHKHIVLALALSASLAACGGGSSSTPTVDNSAAVSQALTNIEKTLPAPSPAYTGAFCTVNNVAIGYVSGTSADAVALSVAQSVVNAPTSNPDAYKAMLSDAGLSVVVLGGLSTVRSSVTGMLEKLPDSKYVVKLTANGIVLKNA